MAMGAIGETQTRRRVAAGDVGIVPGAKRHKYCRVCGKRAEKWRVFIRPAGRLGKWQQGDRRNVVAVGYRVQTDKKRRDVNNKTNI